MTNPAAQRQDSSDFVFGSIETGSKNFSGCAVRDRIRQTSEDAMKRTLIVIIMFLVALAAWTNTPAQAAEITILVNQGALSGVRDLAAGYEKATGHKVVIDFVGVGQQEEKIKTDAPGDLVVNFMPAFDEIIKAG